MNPQGILLIGGTGFVGRALVARLCKKYQEVFVIARNSHDWTGLSNVQSFESSFDNHALLEKILPFKIGI